MDDYTNWWDGDGIENPWALHDGNSWGDGDEFGNGYGSGWWQFSISGDGYEFGFISGDGSGLAIQQRYRIEINSLTRIRIQ